MSKKKIGLKVSQNLGVNAHGADYFVNKRVVVRKAQILGLSILDIGLRATGILYVLNVFELN